MSQGEDGGISFEGLTKRFGSTLALDEISCNLNGRVNLLLGSNGSGKTTLLNILAGISWPDQGKISIEGGKQLSWKEDRKAWRKGMEQFRKRIGILPDKPGYPPSFTGMDLLEFSAGRDKADSSSKEWSGEIIQALQMEQYIRKTISGYSSGMMQKIGIAASLVGKPDFVLWDEPTAALDASSRKSVIGLIKSLLARSPTTTFIITSHIPEDFEGIVDWVGLMRLGKVVKSGLLSSIQKKEEEAKGPSACNYLIETDKPSVVGARLLESSIASSIRIEGSRVFIEVKNFSANISATVQGLCDSLGAKLLTFERLSDQKKGVAAMYQELLRTN
jgi:ABC-type multidrug transport system ATPase subunit